MAGRRIPKTHGDQVAREVLQKLEQQHWDVLVRDITMADRSGLEVLKDIKHLKPELPVLVFEHARGGTILEKMNLTTNAQLTHYAIKGGLVE